jgi:hypothetical protein
MVSKERIDKYKKRGFTISNFENKF